MQLCGAKIEEGINWRMTESSPKCNRAARSVVFLRGRGAGDASTEARLLFEAPSLYDCNIFHRFQALLLI